jgi:hypothetical protein
MSDECYTAQMLQKGSQWKMTDSKTHHICMYYSSLNAHKWALSNGIQLTPQINWDRMETVNIQLGINIKKHRSLIYYWLDRYKDAYRDANHSKITFTTHIPSLSLIHSHETHQQAEGPISYPYPLPVSLQNDPRRISSMQWFEWTQSTK